MHLDVFDVQPQGNKITVRIECIYIVWISTKSDSDKHRTREEFSHTCRRNNQTLRDQLEPMVLGTFLTEINTCRGKEAGLLFEQL